MRILDVYKADLHCRYANAKALWNEVHITSIMHPKAVYNKMLQDDEKAQDKIEQLIRRITTIRYHIKYKNIYYYYDFPVEKTLNEMYEDCFNVAKCLALEI